MSSEVSHLADMRAEQWLFMERIRREQERAADYEPYDHERATITISREYGAGGHTVAAKLVERLGREWQIVDREIVDNVAKSAKVRTEYVECYDDKTLPKIGAGAPISHQLLGPEPRQVLQAPRRGTNCHRLVRQDDHRRSWCQLRTPESPQGASVRIRILPRPRHCSP